MKFIVNNKLYDTDKAELLCSFRKQWESKTIVGMLYPYRDTNLYKTVKGYDKYVEMFGALGEA